MTIMTKEEMKKWQEQVKQDNKDHELFMKKYAKQIAMVRQSNKLYFERKLQWKNYH